MEQDVENLLPPSGGYRQLKTFQLARLAYDVTVLFCDTYVDRRSRTHDQMVQAARSGVQNIAEGSVDSATSKKSELFLTNMAKGSLAELALDFEDYLRQRGLEHWEPKHPALVRFKAARVESLVEFRRWVKTEVEIHGQTQTHTDQHAVVAHNTEESGVSVRVDRCKSVTAPCPSVWVANGALSLLNLTDYLIGRQLDRLSSDFLKQGGFKERMYRLRSRQRPR